MAGGVKKYYAKDQLGSIRDVLSIAIGQKLGSYDYDAYGNLTTTSPRVTELGYAGMFHHAPSNLYLTWYRAYDPKTARWLSSDPIGLAAWDWDGLGNTSFCGYYSKQSEKNPNCSYYKKAEKICYGENDVVNIATDFAIINAWIDGKTNKSRSEIYTSIRSKLVFYDKQIQQINRKNSDGCSCGDSIDFYHDQAFEESGLNVIFYGGNIWPQNTRPNPVPYDPRGSDWLDDLFN